MAAPAEPDWVIRTEVFDGPLDLLLYLVRREGIDLRSLPVSRIADAYLSYIDRMRDLHLGVAGEYLVMAATLVWMKSLELLPRRPVIEEDEEGEDPREALARRLQDYAAVREGADVLESRPRVGRDVFLRMPDEPSGSKRLVEAGLDAFGLLDVFYDLLQREVVAEAEYTVDVRSLSLEEACSWVLAELEAGVERLDRLLHALPSRREKVLTFIAVLEMARLGWVGIRQQQHLGEVQLSKRVEGHIDMTRLTGRVEASCA